MPLRSPPQSPPADPLPDHRRWPLFWFARLESALEAGDLEQAADAQLELERLGLRVEPLPPWRDGATALAE